LPTPLRGKRAGTVSERYRAAAGARLDCAGDVSAALRRVPRVVGVDVLTAANVVVVHHSGTVAVDDVRAAARAAGLTPLPEGTPQPAAASRRWWWAQGQPRRQPRTLHHRL